jgi:hypothetical protein
VPYIWQVHRNFDSPVHSCTLCILYPDNAERHCRRLIHKYIGHTTGVTFHRTSADARHEITVVEEVSATTWNLLWSCAFPYSYRKTQELRKTRLPQVKQATPLQAWTGPEGSRRLRFPDFKTIGTWRWQGCQPYAPAAFTPRKYSRYSFLLEAESTSGPQCGRKDYVNEKFQWHHRESNPRPSDL